MKLNFAVLLIDFVPLFFNVLSFRSGRGGRPGRPGGGRIPRANGQTLYSLDDIASNSCLYQVLWLLTPVICLLLFQGPQGIRGAMGMIGSKGEMVIFLATVPVIISHISLWMHCCFPAYIPPLTDYANIILLQGARGLDGDPGPQGVAGATVSLSRSMNAVVFCS